MEAKRGTVLFVAAVMLGACGGDDGEKSVPRSWSAAVRITPQGQQDQFGVSELGIDDQGNALALLTGPEGQPLSSRWAPGGAWSTPETLAAYGDTQRLATEPGGKAVFLYQEGDTLADPDWYILRARRFTPAAGWGVPELVASEPATSGLDLALASSGDALALHGGGFPPVFRASHSRPDGAWEAPAELVPTSPSVTGIYETSLGIDASGNALAVWFQLERTRVAEDRSLMSRRYTPGSGWGPPVVLQGPSPTLDVGSVRLAVGADGSAVVAWLDISDGFANLVRAAYSRNGQWEAPVSLGRRTQPYFGEGSLQAAIAPDGKAFVVWRTVEQRTEDAPVRTMYSRLSDSGATTAAEIPVADLDDFGLAVDGQGHAILVGTTVSRSGGSYRYGVVVTRFEDGEWPAPVTLASLDGNRGFIGRPHVAAARDGRAVTAWTQHAPGSSEDGAWAARLE